LLGASHINDKSMDLHINEDVWVGSNVTILPGSDLGRGCIVGACSVVSKPVPPYALVVGSPARIVGVKFSIDQILEHEKALYPEKERFTRAYLEELFAKYYEGMKVFGVQTELTEEDLKKLEKAKKKRKYIEPQL
jgi:carbonic anhydrase/acetyltransferase-like protein (isoleucine patch superfamily)